MQISGKLNYFDCQRHIPKNGVEVEFYEDNFFGKPYVVSVLREKDCFFIKVNNCEIAFLSKTEFHVTLEPADLIEIRYILNIANMFLMNGYRLYIKPGTENVYITKYNSWNYLVNKTCKLSKDGKNIYIE